MADEKDEVLQPLQAMLATLPPSMAPDIKAAIAEIERLRGVVTERGETIRKLVARADAGEKQAKDASAENDRLRDDLHDLTVENARHEGYLDRVFEFDPVSDKRLYQDQLHPVMMRPPEEIGRGAGIVEPIYNGASFSIGERRRASWYRRSQS